MHVEQLIDAHRARGYRRLTVGELSPGLACYLAPSGWPWEYEPAAVVTGRTRLLRWERCGDLEPHTLVDFGRVRAWLPVSDLFVRVR